MDTSEALSKSACLLSVIRSLIALAFITASSSTLGQEANLDDVATIDAVVNAYYESVSGPPGKRDADRVRSLFITGGNIGFSLAGEEVVHRNVDEYVYTDRFLTISEDFFEREISRDTQQFRDMANVASTYGISDAMENTNFTARGVMVLQLIRQNDRWWIVSQMFQRESPEFPIPAHLLD